MGALSLVASACSSESGPRRVEAPPARPYVGDGFTAGASTAERFGMRAPAPESTRGTNTDTGAQPAGHGGAPAAGASQHLRWTAPETWTQGPERMMREVTFVMGTSGDAECYISVLGGDGGGIAANLDRWRGQFDRAPFTEAELAALPRVDCLGTVALVVEIDGERFEGMGGQELEDAAMLGAVVSIDTHTVFVKLTGPRDEVLAERENFDAFLASLERTR